jgi:crossover junction endodeoxyribonuclease RuvC
MVKRLLNLPGLPGPDAADALGLAITHAHTARAMALMQDAGMGRAKASGMLRGGRGG